MDIHTKTFAGNSRNMPHVIGVDPGNAEMKTAHCRFPSGIMQADAGMGIFPDTMEKDGVTWALTGSRLPYMRNKSEDARFFMLTMFALAKELKYRGINSLVAGEIVLATTLPLGHYATQKAGFQDYFRHEGPVKLIYNGEPMSLLIKDVYVMPQGYAAAALRGVELEKKRRAFIVDIGGYTTDVLLVRAGSPDSEHAFSLDMGTIRMTNELSNRIYARDDITITLEDYYEVLVEKTSSLPSEIQQEMRGEAKEYAGAIMYKLREIIPEVRSSPVLFQGGGSLLLRDYLVASPVLGQCEFEEDTKANAIGAEFLASRAVQKSLA